MSFYFSHPPHQKKKKPTITMHVQVCESERGWPGKITLCSLLGGTLSFGTFREKRKKTLTKDGEHSIKEFSYIWFE